MKFSITIWITCMLLTAKAQIIHTTNFRAYKLKNLSYKQSNGSLLTTLSDSTVQFITNHSSYILAGSHGQFAQNGDLVVSFQPAKTNTTFYQYDLAGQRIKKETVDYLIQDICIEGKYIYALTSTRRFKPKDDAYILKMNLEFQIVDKWNTFLHNYNTLNIAYHAQSERFIIGAGIEGVYMNLEGDTIGTYTTAHSAYGLSTYTKYHTVLHKYSDGCLLEVLEGDSTICTIKKNFDRPVVLNEEIETSRAFFECWDINTTGECIIALDHSKTVSLFDRKGKYAKDLVSSKNIEFVFFIDEKTFAYYDKVEGLKKMKI